MKILLDSAKTAARETAKAIWFMILWLGGCALAVGVYGKLVVITERFLRGRLHQHSVNGLYEIAAILWIVPTFVILLFSLYLW